MSSIQDNLIIQLSRDIHGNFQNHNQFPETPEMDRSPQIVFLFDPTFQSVPFPKKVMSNLKFPKMYGEMDSIIRIFWRPIMIIFKQNVCIFSGVNRSKCYISRNALALRYYFLIISHVFKNKSFPT